MTERRTILKGNLAALAAPVGAALAKVLPKSKSADIGEWRPSWACGPDTVSYTPVGPEYWEPELKSAMVQTDGTTILTLHDGRSFTFSSVEDARILINGA